MGNFVKVPTDGLVHWKGDGPKGWSCGEHEWRTPRTELVTCPACLRYLVMSLECDKADQKEQNMGKVINAAGKKYELVASGQSVHYSLAGGYTSCGGDEAGSERVAAVGQVTCLACLRVMAVAWLNAQEALGRQELALKQMQESIRQYALAAAGKEQGQASGFVTCSVGPVTVGGIIASWQPGPAVCISTKVMSADDLLAAKMQAMQAKSEPTHQKENEVEVEVTDRYKAASAVKACVKCGGYPNDHHYWCPNRS